MRPTLKARRIMQDYNKENIFTNLYSTCRTVKCYGSYAQSGDVGGPLSANDFRMVDELMLIFGPTSVKVRHPNPNSWKRCPSIIVRIPLE
jgi:hypothetical protein